MKNNFLAFVFTLGSFILLNVHNLTGQVVDSESNSNWIGLSSYNGSTTVNAFRFSINIRGENINYPNWSLVVRANSPITNSEGKIFDPSKISIRINQVTGGPTLTELGANQTPIPLSFNDKYIINRSSFPLKNGSNEYYKKYTFDFDIIIAGGSYLENLKTYQQYLLSLTFSVLGANDKVVTESSPSVSMQIYPNDAPPSGPEFGFEVFADASLNFNVPEDYTRKVESSEESWLKVTSKDKGYTVNVQTSDSYFEGESDIPVGVVSMQVEDKIGSRTGPEIALKNSGQTVFNGNATGSEPRKLDVRYFISPDNAKGLAIYKPGNYVTRLTYTLLPQ